MSNVNFDTDAESFEESADFLLSVILLCRTMIELGFFTEYIQFKHIFDALKDILLITDHVAVKASSGHDQYNNPSNSDKIKIENQGFGMHSFHQEPDETEKRNVLIVSTKNLEIKKNVCNLLSLFLEIQNDIKSNKILTKFKNSVSTDDFVDINLNKKNGVHPDDEKEELQSNYGSEAGDIGIGGLVKMPDYRFTGSFLNIFKEVLYSNERLIPKEDFFIDLLINQTLYDDPELKSITLKLIYKLFSETKTLGSRLQEIQIIEAKSNYSMYEKSEEIAKHLFRLTEKMETWFSIRENTEMSQLRYLLKKIEANLHLRENYK